MAMRDEMQALIDRYVAAFNSHDLDALTNCYTDDGAIYSPYGPAALGRAAIRDTHAEWLAEGERNKRMIMIDHGGEGDTGYCVVGFAGDYPQTGGAYTTERGVSVNIATRQPDGGWKFRVSSLNAAEPEAQ